MKPTRTIKVTPIYGWGWVVGGKPRFEVPTPFTLNLDEGKSQPWTGTVIEKDHEFAGRRVRLSQRHTDWTGVVNVVIDPANATGQSSTGFATLAAHPNAKVL